VGRNNHHTKAISVQQPRTAAAEMGPRNAQRASAEFLAVRRASLARGNRIHRGSHIYVPKQLSGAGDQYWAIFWLFHVHVLFFSALRPSFISANQNHIYRHCCCQPRGDVVRLGVLRLHRPHCQLLASSGSVDQWISGGRCSHGGAEARRKQREESTTRHKGNWRVSCFCL
jgi:hypothetical protein